MTPESIAALRRRLRISRRVFAQQLATWLEIDPPTVNTVWRWETGQCQPSIFVRRAVDQWTTEITSADE